MYSRQSQHLDELVSVFQGMERYVRSVTTEPFNTELCCEGMLQYLQSMGRLNKLWRNGRPASDAKGFPFMIRPKCHLLQHLILDFVPILGSPARFWCYRDEDWVGAIKRICAKTKHPETLEARDFLKLCILEGLLVGV